MGLNFKDSTAQWSYGGFMSFRIRLASAIGINLREMAGFCKEGAGKPWETKDAIVPLLNHSDCEGELTPEECASVAPRLRELVKDWPIHDYDRQTALTLARDIQKRADDGEALIFC